MVKVRSNALHVIQKAPQHHFQLRVMGLRAIVKSTFHKGFANCTGSSAGMDLPHLAVRLAVSPTGSTGKSNPRVVTPYLAYQIKKAAVDWITRSLINVIEIKCPDGLSTRRQENYGTTTLRRAKNFAAPAFGIVTTTVSAAVSFSVMTTGDTVAAPIEYEVQPLKLLP